MSGAVFVVAAALLFAVNGSVSKLALDAGLATTEIVQLRSLCSAVCFVLIAAVSPGSSLRAGRAELARLVVLGIAGIAMVSWLYFVGIDRLPAGIALLLEFLAPVFVVMWVRFVRGEHVSRRMWAALACCLGGLAMVARIGTGGGLDGVGVLAALGAAVALAVYYLMGERTLVARDPISMSAWTFTAAAVFWLVVEPPWSFPWGRLDDLHHVPAPVDAAVPVWALVACIVVAGTVVPYLLVLNGLRRVGSARAGLIGMSEPVLTAAVAWWVLDQRLAAIQVAGGLVVLAGIALAETARRRSGAVAAAPVVPD